MKLSHPEEDRVFEDKILASEFIIFFNQKQSLYVFIYLSHLFPSD